MTLAREGQFWRLGERLELADAMPNDKLLHSAIASPVANCGRALAAVSRSTALHLLDMTRGGVVLHYQLLHAFPPAPDAAPRLIDALAATCVDKQTLVAATFVTGAPAAEQPGERQDAAADAGRLHLFRLVEGDGPCARLELLTRVPLNNASADSIDLLWTSGGALLVAECETGWPVVITAYGLDGEPADDGDSEDPDANDDAGLDDDGTCLCLCLRLHIVLCF